MPCRPVALQDGDTVLPARAKSAGEVQLHDVLPETLRAGAPRPLFYRVEIRNMQGRSAGFSAPALVPAGAVPPPVEGLMGQGVRTGILLQWVPQSGAGEVLLRREVLGSTGKTSMEATPEANTAVPSAGKLSSAKGRSERHAGKADNDGALWLQADPGDTSARQTIDGTVTEGTRYRYTAIRRVQARVAGQDVELRSAPSTPLYAVWKDAYPPPAPTGLTVIGFGGPQGGNRQPDLKDQGSQAAASRFAVDLVWQPVSDTRVTGYLVTRVPLAAGQAEGQPVQLTPLPVTAPAFHDSSAEAGTSYRYEVVAVDGRGNRSAAAEAVLQPSRR